MRTINPDMDGMVAEAMATLKVGPFCGVEISIPRGSVRVSIEPEELTEETVDRLMVALRRSLVKAISDGSKIEWSVDAERREGHARDEWRFFIDRSGGEEEGQIESTEDLIFAIQAESPKDASRFTAPHRLKLDEVT